MSHELCCVQPGCALFDGSLVTGLLAVGNHIVLSDPLPPRYPRTIEVDVYSRVFEVAV